MTILDLLFTICGLVTLCCYNSCGQPQLGRGSIVSLLAVHLELIYSFHYKQFYLDLDVFFFFFLFLGGGGPGSIVSLLVVHLEIIYSFQYKQFYSWFGYVFSFFFSFSFWEEGEGGYLLAAIGSIWISQLDGQIWHGWIPTPVFKIILTQVALGFPWYMGTLSYFLKSKLICKTAMNG